MSAQALDGPQLYLQCQQRFAEADAGMLTSHSPVSLKASVADNSGCLSPTELSAAIRVCACAAIAAESLDTGAGTLHAVWYQPIREKAQVIRIRQQKALLQ